MIYWVSGHQRTGTSMMMGCLISGGMEAVYEPEKDKIIEAKAYDGYKLNPTSIYEVDSKDFNKPDFRERAEGKLVKCIAPGILAHVQDGDKVAFMVRPYEEIAESHDYARLGSLLYNKEEFTEMMADTWGKLETRCYASAHFYPDVVEDPLPHFRVLKAVGWPINPEKAALEVNAKFYRFRNTEGGVEYVH